MKNIGQILKKERKIRGLTQEEFVKEIISESYYSKVERGLNEISAKDLFAILDHNNISEEEFISKLHDSKDSEKDLEIELLQAFYHKDIKEINNIFETISNSNCSERLKLTALIVQAQSQNRIKTLSKKFRSRINIIFFENKEWEIDITALQLFCNSMLLFDFEELNDRFYQLWNFYNCKLDKYSFHIQKLIGTICINFLQNCYLNNKDNDVELAYNLINQLAPIPDLGMFQIVKNYYLFWFKKDFTQCRIIKDFLIKNKLKLFTNNLPPLN